MQQKYRITRVPAEGEVDLLSHIEGKSCECGRILSLSHQGPCPSCGGTALEERVFVNASDLKKIGVGKVGTPMVITIGGTD